MRALAFNGPEAVDIVERPVPQPAPHEALVRIEISALCGSELRARGAVNPGHEAAGIVELAPPSSGFHRGDRVGISAVTGCGTCEPCRRGVQLHCRSGADMHLGMHADYVAVPASALRRVPNGTPAADAVLITGDALGVPMRAQRRFPSGPGDRILVIGLGPVGLGHTLVRAYTGAEVVGIEPSEYRRQLATTLGAAAVFAPDDTSAPAAEIVIECTGLPSCIQLALATVEPGGVVVQSGECPTVEVRPSDTFIRREITYTGAWYYADEDFGDMVRLYESGLPVNRMITHVFPAEDAREAYRCFTSKLSGKVALSWA